jgi:uncharacterized repeat protein (TIGR01451 family)
MDLGFRIRCLVSAALACLFALSAAALAQAAPQQDNGGTCDAKVCGLAISKSGDAVLVDNAAEHFTYTVTSTGITPVTVDKATGVTDDKCSPVAFDGGDANDNDMVDPGESWSFHCDTTVKHADENASHDIVNTATVTGTIGFGSCGCQPQTVTATTTFTTHVVHPSIAVTKTGSPNPVNQGATINYTITVTNTGDIELTAVTATDPKCDNLTPSGSFTLAPGASKTLTCTHVTSASDGPSYTNQVCVSGVATPGGTVSKCAEVTTTITSPPAGTTTPMAAPPAVTPPPPAQVVLGERVTPGSARLVGPTGCVAKVFTVRVRGTKIARAVFRLDGRVVAVRRTGQAFSLRVNPAKFKVGVHRVVVSVTFETGSGTKAKTLRLAFQRCSRTLRGPRFTG